MGYEKRSNGRETWVEREKEWIVGEERKGAGLESDVELGRKEVSVWAGHHLMGLEFVAHLD